MSAENEPSYEDVIHYITHLEARALVMDAPATNGPPLAEQLPYWRQLLHWQQQAQGAMPATSWRALQYDWQQFVRFCRDHQRCPLPASPDTVRLYLLSMATPRIPDARFDDAEDARNWALIEAELTRFGITPTPKAWRKLATIERRAATLAKAHRAAGALNPVDTETVATALKKIRRITDREPQQRRAIESRHYRALLALPVDTLREHQDRLITLIGFESGLRRSRLAAIEIADLEWMDRPNGARCALVRISKDKNQDQTKYKALSRRTTACLDTWLTVSGLQSGPLFRGIPGQGRQRPGPKRLSDRSVVSAMQRCMVRLGESPHLIGGHSTRIGGALHLRERGVDLAELMAYGDWKSSSMPLRYTRKLDAVQTAMLRTLHDDD